MDLWDLLLGRPMALEIMEDNQATIKVVKNGYSPKLRHVSRTHKVDLGSVYEIVEQENVDFYKKVREGYLLLARSLPERFHVVDGTRALKENQEDILKTVLEHI